MTDEVEPARLLVVDDSPANVAVLEARLTRAGYRVSSAADGASGLAAISSELPDLVLLDVMMPVMDGYEVCRRLKADPKTANIPVIFLTALQERADKIRALEIGANDFLSKPVDQAELLARVHTLLELKRVHDRVTDSEARYRELIERLPVITFVMVPEGDGWLKYISPQVEAQLGFPAQAWLDDPELWFRQIPPEQREQVRAGLLDAFAKRGSFGAQFQMATTWGETVWFESRAIAVEDSLGYGRCIEGYLRDVSERKQRTEERDRLTAAIEQERATLAAVMASMSDGLVLFDKDGLVRYCNDQVGQFLGLDPAATIGKPPADIVRSMKLTVEGDDDAAAIWTQAVRRASQRPTLEMHVAGPPRRDLLVLPFPVTGLGDKRIRVGVLVHDVTRERDLARTKDELISVVSHELRTPLASLVGFAELLLKRTYDDAQRHEFLSVMYEEGRRLTALITDFLDLQRMESGHQVVHLRPTSLGPIIERAVATVGDDPVRPVRVRLDPGLPEVEADPDRLLQVLVNLLSNARKYSPNGGEIHVTAAMSKRRGVKVLVEDHGLGLPPEALPKLFEKFYRVDNSDRRSISGTGLGLAICRQIIAEHGGRIQASSPGLGQGSRFQFTLPVTKPNPSGGDVLIVEDDPGFARLLDAALAAVGLTAVRVSNAELALERLAAVRPKAIALDLLLPGALSGEAFLASLPSDGSAPPVVILTAKDLNDRQRREFEQLGAVHVLQKGPAVAQTAAELLSGAIESSRV